MCFHAIYITISDFKSPPVLIGIQKHVCAQVKTAWALLSLYSMQPGLSAWCNLLKFWLHNSLLGPWKGVGSKNRGFPQRMCKGTASWLRLTLPWSSNMTKAESRIIERKVSWDGKQLGHWARGGTGELDSTVRRHGNVSVTSLKAVGKTCGKGQTGLEQKNRTGQMEEIDRVGE